MHWQSEPRPPAIALHPPPFPSALAVGLAAGGRQRHQQRSGGGGGFQPQQQQHRPAQPAANKQQASGGRQSSDFAKLACASCGQRLECFDEETLSLCCVALCTFLHRSTALAAPLLPRTVSRYIYNKGSLKLLLTYGEPGSFT